MFDPDRMTDTPEEADGIIRLSGIQKGSDVLDLCCGEGRHDLEFARRGYNVTGVDITRPYIAEAVRLSSELGLDAEFLEQAH
jgi:2-polyprenyl-3-methyl-5-hydroxy-6-metoxy-1,4-benzoquinol methylase